MTKGELDIPAPRHSIEVQRAQDRINSLEALRGIAAIMVLISHLASLTYNPVLGETSSYVMERIAWELGAPAVDLFIVLSGYVVALSWMRSEKHGTTSFFKRRLIRLMPIYWASLAVAIFLWVFSQGAQDAVSQSATLTLYSQPLELESILANVFPLMVNYGQIVLNAPWWTLHIEIWGMLITPWLIILARNNLPRTIALSIIGIASFEYLVSPLLSYNQNFLLLLGIVAGAIAAVTKDKWLALPADKPIIAILVAVCLFTISIFIRTAGLGDQIILSGADRIIGMAGSLVLVMLMASMQARRKKYRTNKIAVWLGQISYPLYVLHYPIIMSLATMAMSQGLSLGEAQALCISIAPLIILISFGTYHLLDKHAIKRSRKVSESMTKMLSYP